MVVGSNTTTASPDRISVSLPEPPSMAFQFDSALPSTTMSSPSPAITVSSVPWAMSKVSLPAPPISRSISAPPMMWKAPSVSAEPSKCRNSPAPKAEPSTVSVWPGSTVLSSVTMS